MKTPTPTTGFMSGRTQASKASPRHAARLQKLDRAKNELAAVLAEQPAGALGNEVAKKTTRFGAEIDKVRRSVSVSNTNFSAEATNRDLVRTILAASLDLIPIAEKAFRASKKENAMYAYLAAVSKVLELANDLRQMSDVETQSKFIAEKIIHPNFRAQGNTLLQELMALKSSIDTLTTPKRALRLKEKVDTTLRTLGAFIDQSEAQMTGNIERYLSGDLSFTQTETVGGRKSRRRREQ